jgi:prepilin-type N-terminal cleavage/methylation domain-containing protein
MRRRSAFTLLEVLLAMSIGVMVLAAVYSFVGHQLSQAQAGRDAIERATLARSILGRMDTDLRAVIALSDPGRYRLQPDVSGDTAASAATAATSPTTSATGAGTAGKSSPSAASSAGAASSASSPSASSAGTSSTSGSSTTSTLAPIDLPRGVIGSSSELNLYVSRLPTEVFGDDSSDPTLLTSDLRRLSYWMGGDGDNAGLCRMEVRLITSDDAVNTTLPSGDVAQYLYAREVKSVEFGYFDGTAWQTSWDSTTLGPDQATPIGSPRAISIKIEMAEGSKTKTYRHVIAIACADGTPMNNNAEGGTTTGP